MSADGRIRLSDTERATYNDVLRKAFAEGRITENELEERLGLVLNARFESDLLPAVSDLPATDQPRSSAVAVPSESGGIDQRLGVFFIAPVICTAIYAMTNFGGYFWPMWVWLGCMIPVGLSFIDRD